MAIIEGFRLVCTIISFALFLIFLFDKHGATETKLLTIIFACLFMFDMALAWDTFGTEMEAAFLTRRFISLFMFCIIFSVFLFCVRYTKAKVPKLLCVLIAIWSIIANTAMTTSSQHNLFINGVVMDTSGIYPQLKYKLGILGHCYNGITAFLPLYCFWLTIQYYRKPSKTKVEKKRKKILLLSMAIPDISFLLSKIFLDLHYDIILLGLTVSCVILSISAYRYRFFDVGENAKKQMLNTMAQALIILDEAYGFIYANSAAKNLFPELIGTIEGMDMLPLYHKLADNEIEICNRTYEIDKTIVYDGTNPGGYSICLFDVTERRAYEHELILRKEESDQANQSKSDFLAKVSHEIRTPLNAIIGMSILALRNPMEQKLNYQIKSIYQSAQWLLHIINAILDVSKLESGKMELYEENYYLEKILCEVSNLILMNLQGAKVEFHLEVDPSIPNGLIGDTVKIKQILTNLLTNAIKYTNEGEVCLIVHGTVEENLCNLHFEVKDTGIGIAKGDIEKIFQSYERVENETTRNSIGTGLGLSIVNSYLELMEGTIEVESVYGEGTSFKVKLPQKIFEKNSIGELNEKSERIVSFLNEDTFNISDGIKFSGAKILVVDDMEINLEVTKGLLEPYEMKIDTADSADTAIEKIKKNDYDLIFMDHMMPGKDGVKAVQEIRSLKESKYHNVPIIMLSANAMAGMKDFFLDNGFQGFLPKPIDEHTLLETLDQWLSMFRSYEPISNIDYQEGLRNVDNHLERYQKILSTYEQEMNQLIRQLPELARYNKEELRVKVHGIKGGSRSIGARSLGDYAEMVESKLKRGNYQNLEDELILLTEMMEDLLRSIHKYLSQQTDVTLTEQGQEEKNQVDVAWWKQLYELVEQFDSIQAIGWIRNVLPQPMESVNLSLHDLLRLLENMEYDMCKQIIQSFL